MKNIRRTLWGIVFVLAAIVIALNAFEIIDFDIFFEGWWTLFIIIPSIVGIVDKKDKSGSIFGLCFGVFLLLCAQDILQFELIGKLWLPVLIAFIGLKMIFSSAKVKKAEKIVIDVENSGGDVKQGVAVFCGTEMNYDNAVFDGADIVAVFGGVDCDIRNAVIEHDCVIRVCAVFGGIDILVPDNVRVVTNAGAIFGGIETMKSNPEGIHTIYIEGFCVFGGVDIK